MDLQRLNVPTRNQYDHTSQILGPSNFNPAIWLLRHKVTGQLAIRKEFNPEDVRSGFAAREISHLIRLSSCYNICTYREHELNLTTGTAALVMDVYEYGDLWDLLEKHIYYRRTFPEPFIWHVFKSLATALLHMQQGSPPVMDNSYDWILHRDIYPRNIFLDLPTAMHRAWPLVVLGDFGSSITGAAQWEPMELRQQRDFGPPPAELPSNKRSDVYQIGLVIVVLCRVTVMPKNYSPWFQASPAGGIYSLQLNNVLRMCLIESPISRPSAVQLVQLLSVSSFVGPDSSIHDLLLGQPMYGS